MDTCACVNTRTSTAQRRSSYRHRHHRQPCGFNNSIDIKNRFSLVAEKNGSENWERKNRLEKKSVKIAMSFKEYKSLKSQCLPQIWRDSAVAEGPRDALCQLKSCQLLHNRTEGWSLTVVGHVSLRVRDLCNNVSVLHHFRDIGSWPSDHYFRSVCLSVCLCRVFLSRLWSDFDQTRTHVTRLGLVVSPII